VEQFRSSNEYLKPWRLNNQFLIVVCPDICRFADQDGESTFFDVRLADVPAAALIVRKIPRVRSVVSRVERYLDRAAVIVIDPGESRTVRGFPGRDCVLAVFSALARFIFTP
jgi:hypothetical protein